MPTSRPTTPVASDSSSDAGSLSDPDSGWTDLETDRSNGRLSPAVSEDGDSEDAASAIGRYDREEWEGVISERDNQEVHDVGNDTVHVEPPTPAHPSPVAPELPELTLEDWVADAVGSSLMSDDESSTPHMSFHSASSPLRLSFPDPLSKSDQDLLPSHSLSRTQSHSTEGSHGAGSHSPARTESLSSVTARTTSAMTPSDASFSLQDEEEYQRTKETNHSVPPVELVPPAVSYALSIILLGHPPLPPLKQRTLSTIIDMVAIAFDGSVRGLEGSDTARIYEVPIYARQSKSAVGSEVTPTHRIIIEDRTSGMSPSSSFMSIHCPTLALVFIQPPLSSPSLPSLPSNTLYLPLLLPSISDGFASSLLDLSPSVLFEHSVPDVALPDNTAMKAFALHQCHEMDINGSRLDGSQEVLTVEEFSSISTDGVASALRSLLFSPKEATKEAMHDASEITGIPMVRKPIVFISAFLIALLFGSTVFLRGSPPAPSQANKQAASVSQGQKVWSYLHPFINRTPNAEASSSHSAPASSELPPTPPQPLSPAALKSLAVSIFLADSTETQAKATSEGSTPRSDRGNRKVKYVPSHEVRPATIDPAAPHLTIDPPSSKSLSLLPQPRSLSRKGKEKAVDVVPEAQNPFPSTTTSLSTRISNALAPLFDRVQTDLRELHEALDALLGALQRLQRQTSHGIDELVHVLSEHWQGPNVQELTGKVQQVAHSVSETASKRHARARYNARKVRDISERYVSAARQHFEKSVERARGNARTLKDGLASRRRESRAARMKKARAGGCKRKAKCPEYVFESVMALVA